jgi:SHS2 domain-containing protein
VYRWVEHTAELELAIEAGSERQVLEEALVALGELLTTPPETQGGYPTPPETQGSYPTPPETQGSYPDSSPESRHVAVAASDRPALLAGWLEELVFLAESEGFVPTAVHSLELREDGLEASVTGVIDDPPPLVKAVTYHRLTFEATPEGFAGRVVLDV